MKAAKGKTNTIHWLTLYVERHPCR